jgi:hypothetical protein
MTSLGSGSYSGTVTGKTYTYSGTAYEGWNDVVVATLRSRGVSLFTTALHGPQYQITGTTDVILDNSGSYSGISQNPFAQFGIDIVDKDGNNYFFETSFRNSRSPQRCPINYEMF